MGGKGLNLCLCSSFRRVNTVLCVTNLNLNYQALGICWGGGGGGGGHTYFFFCNKLLQNQNGMYNSVCELIITILYNSHTLPSL